MMMMMMMIMMMTIMNKEERVCVGCWIDKSKFYNNGDVDDEVTVFLMLIMITIITVRWR